MQSCEEFNSLDLSRLFVLELFIFILVVTSPIEGSHTFDFDRALRRNNVSKNGGAFVRKK